MFWNYYYESNIQSADCRSNIRRILLMNYGKFSLAGVLVGVVTMLMRVVYSNCKFQFGIYRVYLKCLDGLQVGSSAHDNEEEVLVEEYISGNELLQLFNW